MKNLIVSLILLTVLLVFGLFVFKQTTEAQNNIIVNLLDLPAPPPPNPSAASGYGTRTENFLDKSNPPKDDASIEDVLEYWMSQNNSYVELGYNIKPSGRNLERILAEIEKKPESLTDFLNVLPENTETANLAKRLYDQAQADENSAVQWKNQVKNWLTYHSDYFSDELFKTAQKAGDNAEYVTNQTELLALSRVDWQKARSLLERLLADDKQPVSQTLARWAFYRHAISEDDASDIEKYRDELKAVVENKNASPGMRDLAIDALVKEKDWQGRDDWFVSLLGDETLHDLKINGQSYTGLTTPMYYAPPDKYAAKMLELAGSGNAAVRGAAVRNLVLILDEKRPEIIRALLPWLENPDWAKETGRERQRLIAALANVSMPESVPGLIAVLDEKAARSKSNSNMSGGAMSNSAPSINYNSSSTASEEIYPYRREAINALAKQKDPRAIPALRLVLPQVEPYERINVVSALLASGGFTITEQIEAIESAAKNAAQNNENSVEGLTGNGVTASNRSESPDTDVSSGTRIITNTAISVNSMPYENYRRPYNPSELKPILGAQLAAATEVGDDLVRAMIDRIAYLDAKDAPLASRMRRIMLKWQSAAVNSLLLRDLKNGKAETGAVVKLLSLRKELREKQPNDVFDIRSGTATALGISACLIEDNNEYDAILASDNTEAKTATLACARLIRANLPVRKVAENLQSPNASLALAAERYLESEDSPEARRIVLARHPNEAKILGATTFFAANDKSVDSESDFLAELFTSVTDAMPFAPYYYLYGDSSELKIAEKKLQKEVGENEELLGIYAYDDNFIRIFKDKAAFSWEEDAARYRERTLTEEEFNRFKSYLTANRADELPPFLSFCEEGCDSKELLMLGRQGGRRVFFKGDETPNFFKELGAMFDEMRKPPAKLHYRLEKNIAGLEILFADDNLQALAVWKNSDDFRVLLEDAERAKQIEKELRKQSEIAEESAAAGNIDYAKIAEDRRQRFEQREFENFAWHKIEKNKLAAATAQPAQIEYIPPRDAFPVRAASRRRWKTRTANIELRANEEALYKISRGQIAKVRSGFYMNPLLTPDGAWAIATKYFGGEGATVVRVNLQTGKEFKVKLDGYPGYEAVAFVPSINKVLISGETYEGRENEESEEQTVKKGAYFLLDAQTGTVQSTKSEIRPLAQQTFRPLQSTANADEFWAAIPDDEKKETSVGIYNAKTFAFNSLLKIPQIEFNSMDLWADEKENKIYFVYEGHLLALPLPKRAK